MKVLFVCMGNICRSPLGEAILRRKAKEAGVEVEIDSAGTGDYHVGAPPDERAILVGEKHGCEMKDLRARQVRSEDFEEFDLIIAMDRSNVSKLRHMPGSVHRKIHLARSFVPNTSRHEVPDPYTGDMADFEEVANMLETSCKGILEHIRLFGR